MNKKIYYVYQLLKNFMLIYPMMLILFENDGIDILQTALLLTVWSIPVIVLEIPSGILADKWSRKNMVIIGTLLQAACFALWLVGKSFYVYAVGFVLWGIGLSFCSGAEEALIYDSLKADGEEALFDKVLGRGRFLYCVGITVASFCGGFVAAWWGIQWTLILSVLVSVLSAVTVSFFREVNIFKQQSQETERTSLKTMLKDAYLLFRNKKELLILAVISVTVIGTADILDEFDPLIIKEFGLGLKAVGVIIAAKYIVVAFGNLAGPYIKKSVAMLFRTQKILIIIGSICILGGICLCFTGIMRKSWALLLFALYYFLLAVCQVLAEDYLQQQIEAEGRATVHSVISMAFNLFGILFYAVLGIVFRIGNLFTGLIVVAVYIILTSLLLCMIPKKTLK